jgi:hypothetical protein
VSLRARHGPTVQHRVESVTDLSAFATVSHRTNGRAPTSFEVGGRSRNRQQNRGTKLGAKVHQTPSLADALADAGAASGNVLRVDVVLAELEPDNRAALLTALHGPMVPDRVASALGAIGVSVSAGAIRTWRTKNVR